MSKQRHTPTSKARRKAANGRLTSNALELLEHHVIADDAKLREHVKDAGVELEVAQLIHDARSEAALTQQELAALVGTDQSVISRLENADYEGHSLSMLRRIAQALGKKLEVRFVDAESARESA